ncbi:MAG: Stp1/IreP family PP2C-type Ser/Thr phosphatase [Bacilli bacterium]|nr:Stp1/IreP family PP2C-type Ser/Thr phosphatase [Bacilli bacterium]
MKTFYLTDSGKVRSHNEDSVIITKNQSGDYLMAVADGMGGHSAGEIASSIVVSHISKCFNESFCNMEKSKAVNWMREMAKEVNDLIFDYAKDHPESKGMGTTLVMALVTNDYVLIGNIGDSSGFVLKDSKLHKVTYDHTLVNLLIKAGELTEEEAKDHPKKNVLMKALGANNPIDIDIFDCDMDISSVLLCSDGLTSMLDVEQIEKVLLSESEIEDKVIKLIRKSNNRGGNDNISIAYLEFTESGD